MNLFSGNLFLLLCLELTLEVCVPSFILSNSCSHHWSGSQQFLKDVRSALRKGCVEEAQPAEARGLSVSRVQSVHAVTGATMLRGIAVFFPLFKQRKKCVSSGCAQPSCKDGPCDMKPRVFTLAASLVSSSTQLTSLMCTSTLFRFD